MSQLVPITLNTNRLTLRWIDAGDAQAVYAIFSDPEVVRFWSSPAWTDIAQASQSIEESLANTQKGTYLRLGIVLKESGQLIGQLSFYDIFFSSRRCAIGYALARPFWGKGYLSEAMAAAVDYAFGDLGLNRIEADIDPRNDASAKLLEKMAFVKEGFMRERWIVNGETCDTINYGLLKREWIARTPTSPA